MVLDPNAAVHGACLLPTEHASQAQYRGKKGEEVLPDGVICAGDSSRLAHIWWELEQVQGSCDFAGRDTVADMQFAIDLLHMRFDRIDRDHQIASNLPVRTPCGQQA